MVVKTYKYRLYPTGAQTKCLEKTFGLYGFLYNSATVNTLRLKAAIFRIRTNYKKALNSLPFKAPPKLPNNIRSSFTA